MLCAWTIFRKEADCLCVGKSLFLVDNILYIEGEIVTNIQKDEYVFSVDIEKTQEYYKIHSICDCGYCRNYYAQISNKFPKLNCFLSEFGIDISKPDEITSVEMDNYIDYINVDYTVCGSVKAMGKYEIDIYDNSFLSIVITNGYASPNEQDGEYFTISVTQIKLPWVLDDPFPKPITEKFFKTKKLWERLKNK